MTEFALFRAEGDVLIPQDLARSLWREDQMHGVATSGALARGLERTVAALGRDDLRPARYTVDLFRAPSMAACTVRTNVVREGARICLVDAVLEQDGRPVARAGAIFLAPSEEPGGAVWSSDDLPQPPPLEIAPVSEEPRVPIFHSEAGWSQDFAEHQNASRKQTWQTGLPIVLGEKPTPFQAVAGVADATSMVMNWGAAGVEYINTDITLALSRLPVSTEIGLSARERFADEGIAVGTAVVFDRRGPIGTSTVTALANARRTVDFTEHDFGVVETSGA
ncbi:MAG TPA: thioesterase family protein [Marmoricola sp.]|nr:thioesterase family protein [Marmoricola sp.]